jgi:prepilin-type processing-associated H-X9-DG protein
VTLGEDLATGQLTVLFADGHVESDSPDAVAPRVQSTNDSLWCPSSEALFLWYWGE